ncbi:MAG TPA: NfeD family protein [Caldisericia bacterium]|nr:NfeD family protein [Caldisericia bacterium]HQN48891.1 NfeD family protein [Caldisericia bacterium]
MKNIFLILILLLFILFTFETYSKSERILIVHIEGEIELGLSKYVERALKDLDGVKGVIFVVDTFGGAVDAATQIRDKILELNSKNILTIGWVKGRAWSAGALITLANRKIVFSKGGSMGAAEPIPAEPKTISALKGEFESTCEANGRDPLIGAAMVDKEIEIEGVVKKGEILTLSKDMAKKLGFSDFEADSIEEILKEFNLTNYDLIDINVSIPEQIARFITQSAVREILLIVGFLGLIIEVTTPGFGIPGTMGIISLGLFFGGHMIAGIGNWFYVVLFILGLVLLLVEVFLIPGFGIAGISGIILIFVSTFLTLGGGAKALYSIGIVAVILLILFIILLLLFPKLPIWKKFGLKEKLETEKGYTSYTKIDELIGKKGVVITTLRPSGTIEIDGKKYDALSLGEFIEKGEKIKVIKVEGGKIIVEKI